MTATTHATEPLVRLVPVHSLPIRKRRRQTREKATAVTWALGLHLFLITVLILCKILPAEYSNTPNPIEPFWHVPKTTYCPHPHPHPRPGPATAPEILGVPGSSTAPALEIATLPELEVAPADSRIFPALNGSTYDTLHRDNGAQHTSMFDPAPIPGTFHRTSPLPSSYRSWSAIPTILHFSSLANPSPIVIPGPYPHWSGNR